MVTCHLTYEIDPRQIEAFERFGRRWIALVERSGGTHHGYFLPSEGASDIALATFSFPSFAAYEEYRRRARDDAGAAEALALQARTKCFLRYDRTFFRPVLAGSDHGD